jgi:hypothetical protein
MKVIGIVGTAKNTGKTTTLSAIMDFCVSGNIFPALTSIGYDGEDLDNITYLPKPKLNVRVNSIVATSELCLKSTKAKFDILEKTDITTPLGKVIIVKITKEGELVLAGPNNISHLKQVLAGLKKYDPSLIMVDGALNRMAPMFLVDKLIFSTGASRNTDISVLTNEMELISKIFKIPKSTFDILNSNRILIQKEEIINTQIFSLLEPANLAELLKYNPENANWLYFPNIFSVQVFKNFLNQLAIKNCRLPVIFHEPFRVLLSTNINDGLPDSSFLDMHSEFYLKTKPDLIAVTINPFYPELVDYHFKASYIDKKEFKEKMREKLKIPVINILDEGIKEIIESIL